MDHLKAASDERKDEHEDEPNHKHDALNGRFARLFQQTLLPKFHV